MVTGGYKTRLIENFLAKNLGNLCKFYEARNFMFCGTLIDRLD